MESKEEIKLNDHEVQYLCLALTERIRFYKTLILRARRQAQTAKDEEQSQLIIANVRYVVSWFQRDIDGRGAKVFRLSARLVHVNKQFLARAFGYLNDLQRVIV